MQTDFNDRDLEKTLAEIAQSEASGSFTLSNSYVMKQFNFRNGHITAWSTSNRGRQIGSLGFALLQLELTSSQTLLDAFLKQREQKKHYCQILCEEQAVSEDDVHMAASQVVLEEVCEAFTWEQGEYDFAEKQFSSTILYGDPYLQSLQLSVPITEVLKRIPGYLEVWYHLLKQLKNLLIVPVMVRSTAKELQEYLHNEVVFFDVGEIEGTDKMFDSTIGQRIQKDLAYLNGKRILKEVIPVISSNPLHFCNLVVELLHRNYYRVLRTDELLELVDRCKRDKNIEDAEKYYQLLMENTDLPADRDFESMLESTAIPVAAISDSQIRHNAAKHSHLQFPGYDIIEEIGEGAMGKVYKAEQQSLNRYVAIKIIPPNFSSDEIYIRRLELEAKTMAQLRHPHIVAAIDFGFQNRHYYIVMEYIEGGHSLRDIIRDKGPLPEKKVLEIGLAMAQALKYLADNRLVHRDIKPGNILIDKDGTPKLADLGLIKDTKLDMRLTVPGAVLGTPVYMSPEQIQTKKDIDIRSDIYSLGATLLNAITGKSRFEGCKSVGTIYYKVMSENPRTYKKQGNISTPLDKIFCKMLQLDPENRYQTVDELIKDLQRVLRRHTQSPLRKMAMAIIFPMLVVGLLSWYLFPKTTIPDSKQSPGNSPNGHAQNNPGQQSPQNPPPEKTPQVTDTQQALAEQLQKIEIMYHKKQYAQIIGECTTLLHKNDKIAQAYYFRGQALLNLGDLQEATTDFAHLIILRPASIDGFLGKAYANYLQGNYSQALATLKQTQNIKQDPEFYYLRARIYRALGRNEYAKNDLNLVKQQSPTFWKAHYLNSLLWRKEDTKMAVQSLNLALEHGEHQNSPQILAWLYYYRGILLLKLEKYLQAEQALNKALQEAETREIVAYLGWAALLQNKFSQALQNFNYALSLPILESKGIWEVDIKAISAYSLPLTKIYYGRGKAYLELKNLKLAMQEFNAALRLNSKFLPALRSRFAIYKQQQNYQEIIYNCDILLEIEPQDTYRWERAKALFHLKRYAQAIRDLSLLLDSKYKIPKVLRLRFQSYLALKDHEAALEDLHHFLRIAPEEPQALLQRGILLQQRGKIAAAIEDYRRTIYLAPKLREPYRRLIEIYNKQRNHIQLVALYKKLLELDGDNVEVLYGRGRAYFELKELALAIHDFSSVIRKRRRHEQAHFYRGFSYYLTGKAQLAIADLSYSIALNPERVQAYYLRGVLLQKKQEYRQAISDFNKFLGFQPQNEKVLLARAQCRSALKQYDTAILDLDKLLLLFPGNVTALELRGECLFKLQKYPQAIQNFRKALKFGTLSAESWNYSGYCHSLLNQPEQAIREYRKALNLQPDFSLARINLAISLYTQGRYEDAIAEISQVINQEPDNAKAYENRGKIYLKMEDYQKAADDFSRLLKLKPNDGATYYHRGLSFYKLKNYQRAAQDFRQTLRYERGRRANLARIYLGRLKKISQQPR